MLGRGALALHRDRVPAMRASLHSCRGPLRGLLLGGVVLASGADVPEATLRALSVAAGVPEEVVPGVTTALACTAGMLLMHRDAARAVTVMVGPMRAGRLEHDAVAPWAPEAGLVATGTVRRHFHAGAVARRRPSLSPAANTWPGSEATCQGGRRHKVGLQFRKDAAKRILACCGFGNSLA